MIKILLASHGNLAKGMIDSLEIIIGKQNNIESLCAYKAEEFDLTESVKKIINDLKKDENLIVITDIFGGSVNNEFMKYVSHENIFLISGLNLSLVLEVTTIVESENIEKKLKEVIVDSKEQIKYCKTLIEEEIEEDFF